jgi:hypothetical protein
MALLPWKLLEGPWPVLQQAYLIPDIVMDKVLQDANGSAITNHIGYFSLGFFYIDCTLLVPHSTQRPIDNKHADKLLDDFSSTGIFRTESPGVIIGLGEGWNHMRNGTPTPYKISKSSPHLKHLAKSSGGPIGQIIRGNHHTEAIRRFSSHPLNFNQNFWCYHVLVPGEYILIICLFHFSHFMAGSQQ